MLFKIKLVSEEVDGFLREIAIESEATFLDLNKAILESCGYPDDQMTSFYICNDEWERYTQITREDVGGGANDEDIYEMQHTRLSEFLEDKGQKMQFVFDPFSDRVFYMSVKDVELGKHLDRPAVVRSIGTAPQQIEDLDLSTAPVSAKGNAGNNDSYDDIFSAEGFNDDEFDPEGYEISDNPF